MNSRDLSAAIVLAVASSCSSPPPPPPREEPAKTLTLECGRVLNAEEMEIFGFSAENPGSISEAIEGKEFSTVLSGLCVTLHPAETSQGDPDEEDAQAVIQELGELLLIQSFEHEKYASDCNHLFGHLKTRSLERDPASEMSTEELQTFTQLLFVQEAAIPERLAQVSTRDAQGLFTAVARRSLTAHGYEVSPQKLFFGKLEIAEVQQQEAWVKRALEKHILDNYSVQMKAWQSLSWPIQLGSWQRAIDACLRLDPLKDEIDISLVFELYRNYDELQTSQARTRAKKLLDRATDAQENLRKMWNAEIKNPKNP